MQPRNAVSAVLAATLLLTACAEQRNISEPVVRDQLQQQTATVESIYQPTRMVSLRGENGAITSVMVGPEVRNFDQIDVGDKVVVSYYQGIAAELKKPGEGVRGVESEVDAITAKPGERPAGAVGTTLRTTVTIESINTTSNIVTFRRQDGMTRALAVESDDGRRFMRELRPGDEVEVTYTEAVAVEVRPAQ